MALLSTDPLDLLLDDNNDLVLGPDGDLVFARGVQGVTQLCRIALQMFQGEWFLNLDAGIPYWQNIIGKKPALAMPAAILAFRAALQTIPGVASVLVCDATFDGRTRTVKIRWAVQTAFGDTPVDVITQRLSGATVGGSNG